MKYIFLLNSFTIKEKINEVIKKVTLYANQNKIDYEIEVNSPTYDTEDIIRKYKKDDCLIIVIGGDGVINRAVNEIVKTNLKLAVIPYGTGNDYYKTIKRDLSPGINKVDVVKINKKYFVNTACFGIDADIANNKKTIKTKLIPKSQKYNAAIVYNYFKYKCKDFELEVNGKKIKDKFTTIAIANGSYYGGGFKIGPTSNITDGVIEVYYATYLSKPQIIPLILKIKNGTHEYDKHITKIETKKVIIKSPCEVIANIDGEELQDDKFVIEVLPNELEVFYDEDMVNYLSK